MNIFTTPAVLTKYNPRKDRSVTISFETDEKSAEQIAELHGIMGTYGALVFKAEDQLTPKELKEIKSLDLEMAGKSKSERLRNVLYVLHQQENKGSYKDEYAVVKRDFNDYYAQKMEEIINHYKGKLE